MKTLLFPGEALYKDGMSSLYRGIETVGGWLYLTNQRLIFEPHALNVQTDTIAVPLTCIHSVEPAYSLMFNIPIFPNAIHVATRDGFQFRMLVHQREDWVHGILQLRANIAAAPVLEAKVL